MRRNKLDQLRALKWDALLRSQEMYEEAIKEPVTAEDIPTLTGFISSLFKSIELIHDIIFDDQDYSH
jgi:hypothetical protein